MTVKNQRITAGFATNPGLAVIGIITTPGELHGEREVPGNTQVKDGEAGGRTSEGGRLTV